MRRLLPLLVAPALLLACSDEPADTAASPTTTESTVPAAPAREPAPECATLMIAAGSDDAVERQEAFATLHDQLPEKEGLHEALSTLEAELGNPQDGEALDDAMTVLNDELHCGG